MLNLGARHPHQSDSANENIKIHLITIAEVECIFYIYLVLYLLPFLRNDTSSVLVPNYIQFRSFRYKNFSVSWNIYEYLTNKRYQFRLHKLGVVLFLAQLRQLLTSWEYILALIYHFIPWIDIPRSNYYLRKSPFVVSQWTLAKFLIQVIIYGHIPSLK